MTATIAATNKQTFKVFANIQMPIEIKIEGMSQEDVKEKLDSINIQQAFLNLLTMQGEVISAKVWDHDLSIEDIEEN
ncbi:hypothetical protein V7122_19360 [Bacillus sp. JJ1532]|uniref:hypothetical protein n=1 Tax=Bacillus sp. JJ1532 TaxID=3122958 RepID=UPI002FFD97B9